MAAPDSLDLIYGLDAADYYVNPYYGAPYFVNDTGNFVTRSEADAYYAGKDDWGRDLDCYSDGGEEERDARGDRGTATNRSRDERASAAIREMTRRRQRVVVDGGNVFTPLPRPDAHVRHADGIGPAPVSTSGVDTNPPSGARGGGRKKRRKARGGSGLTHRDGVERFCRRILAWRVDHLAASDADPCRLGLAPLPKPSTTFRDASEYYAVHEAIAFEEARATLARSLARPRNPSVPVILRDAGHGGGGGGRTMPAGLHACVALEATRDFAGGGNAWGRGGGGRAAARDDWRRPGTVLVLRDGSLARPTLAIVAGASVRMERAFDPEGPGSGPGIGTGMAKRGAAPVALWFGGSKPPPFHGGVVQAEVLDTVIAQQRMVAAAHVAPKVPFMPLLVGAKGPTHVKFASDSDTEEGDAPRRREDDEKEEEPHEEPHETSSGFEDLIRPLGFDLNPSQLAAGAKFIAGMYDPGRGDAAADEFSHPPLRGSLQLVQGPPGCGKTKFVAAAVHAAMRAPDPWRNLASLPPATWHQTENLADLASTKRELGTWNGKVPRVLVCAPSNKAVTVALREYLGRDAVGRHGRYPVLVGAEDALALVCGERDGDDGLTSKVMERFVYRRTSVLASRISRAARGAGAANTESARALSSVVRAVIVELEYTAPSFFSVSPHSSKSLEWYLYHVLHTCDREGEEEKKGTSREVALGHARDVLNSASGRGAMSDEYACEAIANAELVFSTLASSGQGIMAHMPPPDALIVDEAAQALESEVIIAFARGPRRCLLVGDPAQLPATTASERLRRAGHDVSLMQRLLNVAGADEERRSEGPKAAARGASSSRAASRGVTSSRGVTAPGLREWYTLLDTQYRMHPDISAFPSARFYAGAVRDADAVISRRLARVFPMSAPNEWLRSPFLFVDVASGREERAGTEGTSIMSGFQDAGASLANASEAELAAALAVLLPRALAPNGDVAAARRDGTFCATPSAIIAFYAEQVRRIRREYDDRASLASRVASNDGARDVGTVHRTSLGERPGVHSVDSFQGSEADVVVLSAVRANDRGAVGFLSDKRRLNVGLTRARQLCVVLGNASTLARSGGDLGALVEEARGRGALVGEGEVREWLNSWPRGIEVTISEGPSKGGKRRRVSFSS